MAQSISEILSRERTQVGVAVSSKHEALEYLSEFVAGDLDSSSPQEILAGFLAREDMGSTGIGSGIAIPHCRLPSCTVVVGALIKLREPVDFDSVDQQPVDLIFALLAPEGQADEHVRALALLAERLNRPEFTQALREASDRDVLYESAVDQNGAKTP